jgi:hypothetical protein
MKFALFLLMAVLATSSAQAIEFVPKNLSAICARTSDGASHSYSRLAQGRQPQCCGQCPVNGRPGCWLYMNGKNYCSPC